MKRLVRDGGRSGGAGEKPGRQAGELMAGEADTGHLLIFVRFLRGIIKFDQKLSALSPRQCKIALLQGGKD